LFEQIRVSQQSKIMVGTTRDAIRDGLDQAIWSHSNLALQRMGLLLAGVVRPLIVLAVPITVLGILWTLHTLFLAINDQSDIWKRIHHRLRSAELDPLWTWALEVERCHHLQCSQNVLEVVFNRVVVK